MIVTDREALSVPCEEATKEQGLNIANELVLHLLQSEGIGIAANQIGIQKRVFVLLIDRKYEIFVNPVIHEGSDMVDVRGEGCLSFPNELLDTKRYNSIVISDLLNPTKRKLTGLWAVAAQHEMDHLDGITFHSRT